MGFRIGHLTDQGRVRELNEDSYLVLTQPNLPPTVSLLLAVADGMGGHQAGDVASGQVIATLDHFFSTGQFQQLVDYNPDRSDYFAAVLKDVIEAINEQLVSLADRPGLQGMGTTATVTLLSGQQLFIGHVGDSRAYLLRAGLLQQITQDHSWVADQVANGVMTAAEAYHHPKKNLLLRSLGNHVALRVDRLIEDVYAGDTIILCSDGLVNKVNDWEIAQIIAAQSHPQAACQQLVSLANQRGGEDNITVLIAHLDERPAAANLPGGRAFGPQQRHQPATAQNLVNTEKIIRPASFQPTGVIAAPPAYPQAVPSFHPSRAKEGSFSLSKLWIILIMLLLLQLGTTILFYFFSSIWLQAIQLPLPGSVVFGGVTAGGFLVGVFFGYWLFYIYRR